jgi:hypothetical protein
MENINRNLKRVGYQITKEKQKTLSEHDQHNSLTNPNVVFTRKYPVVNFLKPQVRLLSLNQRRPRKKSNYISQKVAQFGRVN